MKEQKNRIKDLLLDTAEVMFAENGYEGTTVRDIAAKAGINPALIYYHFESKEHLYKSIFELRLRLLTDALKALPVSTTASSFEKLTGYIAVYMAGIRDNFYFYRILNCELFSFRNNSFKATILENAKACSDIFRDVIRTGVAGNEFRHIDTDLFLMTLFHLLHQIIGGSPLASELLNLEEITEEQITSRITNFICHQLCLSAHPCNNSHKKSINYHEKYH
ncbi:TetR/AcrR family transcriptional regulator [Chitinophaga ginsengisoli]|uniref:TetR family transcriptional regulator n=1 Tax=Chitinophaga ginsengisoli TaxID=363837 RepID=A0A2P8FMY2_9BACT|nr:TetR/AcrR family transcriptional regulator [Chitinophaga ginsengisoli]PSL23079.1 TetR family transcriptional regulator [Chitinophaga ginsengisoli]